MAMAVNSVLPMFQRFSEGADFSENGQSLSAIREAGLGSHLLGCAHAQANFETTFWRSIPPSMMRFRLSGRNARRPA